MRLLIFKNASEGQICIFKNMSFILFSYLFPHNQLYQKLVPQNIY